MWNASFTLFHVLRLDLRRRTVKLPSMAQPRTTFAKRQRERAKQEKKEEKARRAAERKETKLDRGDSDVDPDIAGIVPGPQPPLDDL